MWKFANSEKIEFIVQPPRILSFAVFIHVVDVEIGRGLNSIPRPLLDRDLSRESGTWHTREARVSITVVNTTEAEILILLRDGSTAVDRFVERMDIDHANGLGRDLAVLFSGPDDDAH